MCLIAAALRKKGVTRSNNELIHSLSSHLTIELISDSSQTLGIYVSHSATDKYVLHCITLVYIEIWMHAWIYGYCLIIGKLCALNIISFAL